ncbi:MAG: glycosyltransferase family 4 protein [Desulfobacteraceae bacterium]|nr:glycosyltransferase family 4 protein [Desulfobacteraceae bacterium]
MAKRALFLAHKCLLDTRSGAAIQVRSLLETLAVAGYECASVTASLFDGESEFPVHTIFGNQGLTPENKEKVFVIEHQGVRHHILNTKSTVLKNFQDDEALKLQEFTKKYVTKYRPDIVICYGGRERDKALQKIVRPACSKMAFHLANASYSRPSTFAHFDQVWCPTNFLCKYYREKVGIHPIVMRTILPQRSFVPPSEVLAIQSPELRKQGFITFINPSLLKGAALFLQLLKMARKQDRDWTFLVVEGRLSQGQFNKQFGVDLARVPNVWWLPNQFDIRPVYRRTAALLMPSFGLETAGRAVAEAQLGGIPVLASNHGGIPEQMNGGGFLFDIPMRCRNDFHQSPSEDEVRPWLNKLTGLMEDIETYEAAVNQARIAGRLLHPDHTRKAAIKTVEALLE